jgi:hypothetical protein
LLIAILIISIPLITMLITSTLFTIIINLISKTHRTNSKKKEPAIINHQMSYS